MKLYYAATSPYVRKVMACAITRGLDSRIQLHNSNPNASPADLVAVGKALKVALGSLRDVVGDVAYNLVFHSAPYRAPEPYHWHVHVVPKLTTVAGFELGTGVLINIVNPEEAAIELAVRVPVARAG